MVLITFVLLLLSFQMVSHGYWSFAVGLFGRATWPAGSQFLDGTVPPVVEAQSLNH